MGEFNLCDDGVFPIANYLRTFSNRLKDSIGKYNGSCPLAQDAEAILNSHRFPAIVEFCECHFNVEYADRIRGRVKSPIERLATLEARCAAFIGSSKAVWPIHHVLAEHELGLRLTFDLGEGRPDPEEMSTKEAWVEVEIVRDFDAISQAIRDSADFLARQPSIWRARFKGGLPQNVRSTTDSSANSASATKIIWDSGIEPSADVVDLVAALAKEATKPKKNRDSQQKVAEKFTRGDVGKANSLLATIRKYRRKDKLECPMP